MAQSHVHHIEEARLDLLNTAPMNLTPNRTPSARQRRALIVADATMPVLAERLAVCGYETQAATTGGTPQAISLFAPDIAIFEFHGSEDEVLALARRLRAEPLTSALPLVFVYSEDEQATLRSAALNIGADDYFALSASTAEIEARLDSLFWRVEAGRRAPSAGGDRRIEIDNFMLMLDCVREDIRKETGGTIAVIYAIAREGGKPLERGARDRTLAEAQAFLKLYLRRVDAIAFYGPTTLLVYLPRMSAQAAADALHRLRDDFLRERDESDIAVGLASFPADGGDVEALIEKAEDAVSRVLKGSTAARVVAYGVNEATAQSSHTAVAQEEEVAEPVVEKPSIEKPPLEMPAPVSLTMETEAKHEPSAVTEQRRTERFSAPVVRESRVLDDMETMSAPLVVPKSSRMPANGADPARIAAEAAARERERRASGAIMPRRLLLTVSDAARMAQINALIRSAGYEARAAFDGQQALDLLRIERPDLLLLDYDLHGMNGLETLRRLRKQGGGRLTLPVVMLVSPGNDEAGTEALELGVRKLVVMPYDPEELLTCVRVAGSIE
jgi:DNA-binding response OmpR family regulator